MLFGGLAERIWVSLPTPPALTLLPQDKEEAELSMLPSSGVRSRVERVSGEPCAG